MRVFRFPLACLRYMAWLIVEWWRMDDPVIDHPRFENKPLYYMFPSGKPIYSVNVLGPFGTNMTYMAG